MAKSIWCNIKTRKCDCGGDLIWIRGLFFFGQPNHYRCNKCNSAFLLNGQFAKDQETVME